MEDLKKLGRKLKTSSFRFEESMSQGAGIRQSDRRVSPTTINQAQTDKAQIFIIERLFVAEKLLQKH